MADHLRPDSVVLQHIIQYVAGLDGKYFVPVLSRGQLRLHSGCFWLLSLLTEKKSNKNTWIIDISVKKSHGIKAYLALLFPTKWVPGVYIATYS